MSDGGAAQRSNMFKKGDVLTHVNGTDVQRLKIHQVSTVTHTRRAWSAVMNTRHQT
jgi:hypothetical protein